MGESLKKIQQKLKAPKNQRNNFGNYNYRNCEDILEAVKPLLAEENATLTLSDELVQIGERYYVKATATFAKDDENESVTAYARESESKKGMDDAQITGAASSYARKYALNGLFLIDDTKDADTDEYAKTAGKANTTASKTLKMGNKLDFKQVREHLSEITTEEELNKYWFSLKLSEKQEAVLKGDFAKRKAALGAGAGA